MRTPVIAGNWKMYKLIAAAVETVTSLKVVGVERNPLRGCDHAFYTALKDCSRPRRRFEHPHRWAGLCRIQTRCRLRARCPPK